jgi:polar amino acid transport system permease protein
MKLEVIIKQLWGGLGVSCSIFFLTLIFSLPLGFLIMFGARSKNKLLSGITRVYISIMRGTPLMLQILVVYFGPYYFFRIPLSTNYRFYAVILAFVINYAAYFAEIYRGGYDSIPKGQFEAAELLGYSRTQTFTRIILPQLIKVILPSITNEVITLIKDTSMAFTVAVTEMFTIAKSIAAAQKTMVPFIVAGVFYYVFNYVTAWVMAKIEKHFSYYHM